MTTERFATFEEFWPYYLEEHSDPTNRRLHQVGTSLALGTVAAAVFTRTPMLALGALVAGYGPAWIGHFIIEKNRPATFTYPLWSLAADFKMNGMMWTGRLDGELERLGLLESRATTTADV